MEQLLKVVRELAPPAVWSAGVELSRNSEFHEVPSAGSDERIFRLVQRPRDPVYSITLSAENESWQCDCPCEDDPCRHVIAALIAVAVIGGVGQLGNSANSTFMEVQAAM
jgi:uncharacterized Zn finger protein